MSDQTPPPVPRRRRLNTAQRVTVGLLLAVPVIVLLAVPTYSKTDPYLLGFPFFYWWQLLWMFVEAGMVYLAYRIITRKADPR